MKKPQNRFIEEIEKDSAGSFAGSSENRSSDAGVAGKNDSSRKCGAAGGFGMAGGTAVITGGGAILGGSGAIPMMAVMLTTSEGIWDEQYAKILVYGRYILRECIGDEEGYRILRSRISAIHQQVENQLKDMKEEKNSLDRETISLTESFLKYLRRLDREMQKK